MSRRCRRLDPRCTPDTLDAICYCYARKNADGSWKQKPNGTTYESSYTSDAQKAAHRPRSSTIVTCATVRIDGRRCSGLPIGSSPWCGFCTTFFQTGKEPDRVVAPLPHGVIVRGQKLSIRFKDADSAWRTVGTGLVDTPTNRLQASALYSEATAEALRIRGVDPTGTAEIQIVAVSRDGHRTLLRSIPVELIADETFDLVINGSSLGVWIHPHDSAHAFDDPDDTWQFNPETDIAAEGAPF